MEVFLDHLLQMVKYYYYLSGGGGSLEVLNIDHIFIGSGSVTENLHLSGGFK